MSLERQASYQRFLQEVVDLVEQARSQAVRAVNLVMVSTYWDLGRKIVVQEQGGKGRAKYGEQLLEQLSVDLTKRFGRGYSATNLRLMRKFYQAFPQGAIQQMTSAELGGPAGFFLSWSHYVLLLQRTRSEEARNFYHAEALRGGWTVPQLERQLDSQFYERLALSRNKAAMLKKAPKGETLSSEEAIKDPVVLEFLNLKDEYSESDLEEALIEQLEQFLLELGSDFTFVGRQKRLRIGQEWYRVDLTMFHRRLRCLVIIDLKIGKLTHADAGQMHMYLNYAREHWTNPGENPPVGLILCANKDAAVARYALEGLPNKVLAAEYRLQLPEEKVLVEELERTQTRLMSRTAKPQKNKPKK